ncbi:hypothetical protein VTK73DRAFT_4025 [Phialemonium thermophilum]|uniref:AB hydrolase-1 domain-containing protein n=1 Tax=Phialemonium thermophilum TaxID=223376 RepID=A0ABR3WVP5_9PEZI
MPAKEPPTLLVVHGAAHGDPIFYAKFRDALQRAGIPSEGGTAPSNGSLPKTGRPFYDDADYWRAKIRALADAGKDVVLLMHSAGGGTGTEAARGVTKADRAEAGLPGGVVHLIYLGAYIPDEGDTILTFYNDEWKLPLLVDVKKAVSRVCTRFTPCELASSVPHSTLTLGRCAGRRDRHLCHRLLRRQLLQRRDARPVSALDPPPEALRGRGKQWKKEGKATSNASSDTRGQFFAQPLTYAAWKDVPTSVILTEYDKIVTADHQRRRIQHAKEKHGVDLQVVPLASSHSPFLSMPDKLTEAVRAIYEGIKS